MKETARPLIVLDTKDASSYGSRKETYVRNRFDQTYDHLLQRFPNLSEKYSHRDLRKATKIYLAGQFAAEQIRDTYLNAIQTNSTPPPITIEPAMFASSSQAGLANPAMMTRQELVRVFDLPAGVFEGFFQNISDENVEDWRVHDVQITLGISYILSELDSQSFRQLEQEIEKTGAHEMAHALYFLSTNSNPIRRARMLAAFARYPHPDRIDMDNIASRNTYYFSEFEKQARRWENYFARHYLGEKHIPMPKFLLNFMEHHW